MTSERASSSGQRYKMEQDESKLQTGAGGSMEATTERILFSSKNTFSDIDLPAVDAVHYERESWNSLMYIGLILISIGLIFIIGGPGDIAVILFIVGGLTLLIGHFKRDRQLVLVTPGKQFKYKNISKENARIVAKEIRELKRVNPDIP